MFYLIIKKIPASTFVDTDIFLCLEVTKQFLCNALSVYNFSILNMVSMVRKNQIRAYAI